MKQIFTGLFTEGTTDVRFLESIIQKTLDSVAIECKGQIEITLNPIKINKTGLSFVEQVLSASKKGYDDYGIIILCVQADADNSALDLTYSNKIIPAQEALRNTDENEYCKHLAAVIPIQETESWMLADTTLLKFQIGTEMSDVDLGIHRFPESVARPKEVIEEAIRIARQDLTKRRRRELRISELYLPIGQAVDLNKLEVLSSYQNFKENIRQTFRDLNLLH